MEAFTGPRLGINALSIRIAYPQVRHIMHCPSLANCYNAIDRQHREDTMPHASRQLISVIRGAGSNLEVGTQLRREAQQLRKVGGGQVPSRAQRCQCHTLRT
jgi:hypothetical protein